MNSKKIAAGSMAARRPGATRAAWKVSVILMATLLTVSLAACGGGDSSAGTTSGANSRTVGVTSSSGADITNANDFLAEAEKEWRAMIPDFATVSDDAGCWFDAVEVDAESKKPTVGERVLCGPAVLPVEEPRNAWSSGYLEEKVSGDGVTLAVESWDLLNAAEPSGNLLDAAAEVATVSLEAPEAKPFTAEVDGKVIEGPSRGESTSEGGASSKYSIVTGDVFAAAPGTTLTLWEHAVMSNGSKETEYDGTRSTLTLPEVD